MGSAQQRIIQHNACTASLAAKFDRPQLTEKVAEKVLQLSGGALLCLDLSGTDLHEANLAFTMACIVESMQRLTPTPLLCPCGLIQGERVSQFQQ